MPLPDPYADEPTAEVDGDVYKSWIQARINADGWTKEAERLRKRLQDDLGDATAGTLNGEKVIYYRYQDSWATARLIKDNPDLTQHYFTVHEVSEFDLDQFRRVHQDIADKYRTRAFKAAG